MLVIISAALLLWMILTLLGIIYLAIEVIDKLKNNR